MQTNSKTKRKLPPNIKMTATDYNNLVSLVKRQMDFHEAISNEAKAKIQENKNFLIESKGWVTCNVTGNLLPKEFFQEFYRSYQDFLSERKCFAPKKSRGLYKDTLLNVLFSESAIYKYSDEEGKIYDLAESHLLYKIDSGEIFKNPARITRQKDVYVPFPHYYYDNKKSPKNWNIPPNPYGIELEVKFPNAISKLKFSQDLKNSFPLWNCERDGSLEDIQGDGNAKDGGLELISPPLGFDTLERELTQITDLLKKYSALGHNTGSDKYGLHITHGIVDENGTIKVKQTSNYIRFINDPRMTDFWRNFCRREQNKFCKAIGNYEGRLDSLDNLRTYTKSYDETNHHNAICMREALVAIETRLFRSTINPKTLRATIEFVKLANAVSSIKYDPKVYLEYIFKNASRHLLDLFDKTSASLSFEYLKKDDSKYSDEGF